MTNNEDDATITLEQETIEYINDIYLYQIIKVNMETKNILNS